MRIPESILLGISLLWYPMTAPAQTTHGFLLVANKGEQTLSIFDPDSGQQLATVPVGGITGHEVAASPDGKTAWVPIYGNSGVGLPGTDGTTITVIDPARSTIVETIPTGAQESHMLAISSDGKRGYTANVGPGTVSAIDLESKKLLTTIPISKITQRIALSPDDRWAFTADQTKPQLAVIDTAENKIKTWIELP